MAILLAAIPIASVARTADLLAGRVLVQDVGEAVIRLRAARQARGMPLSLLLLNLDIIETCLDLLRHVLIFNER